MVGHAKVHVHRDCTGNPNLHITTLGDVFVNPDGSGSRTFWLAPSLRDRGFALLVYPLGVSQGAPAPAETTASAASDGELSAEELDVIEAEGEDEPEDGHNE